tara:strand:+ start:647 stop:1243 length:597 start_codon:yes stop_codon:yes gene_type:complete
MLFDAMQRFGFDADNVMSEIAQMEMALAKVSVESNIELLFKVAMITETGVSIMRDDATPVEEILDHVSSSIDKGIVTATTTIFPGKVAKLSDDEVEGMVMASSEDDEYVSDMAHQIIDSDDFERVKDVVICIVQYKKDGDSKALMMVSDVTEKPTGGQTLGAIECVGFSNTDNVPVRGDFIFDGTKFTEWPIPNGWKE